MQSLWDKIVMKSNYTPTQLINFFFKRLTFSFPFVIFLSTFISVGAWHWRRSGETEIHKPLGLSNKMSPLCLKLGILSLLWNKWIANAVTFWRPNLHKFSCPWIICVCRRWVDGKTRDSRQGFWAQVEVSLFLISSAKGSFMWVIVQMREDGQGFTIKVMSNKEFDHYRFAHENVCFPM